MRRTTLRGIRQSLSSVPFKHVSETPCVIRPLHQCLRPFSNTTATAADIPSSSPSGPSMDQSLPKKGPQINPSIADIFQLNSDRRTKANVARKYNPTDASMVDYSEETGTGELMPYTSLMQKEARQEPHHFHIYATKHNTHITVTTPERNPLISVACGNIGFRKSGRKHYDSAFQLAGYVMRQMQEKGINAQITKLEVVLRGFGAGREAVSKALLGAEGRFLRNLIVKVSDSTRLKFGGTRGKKPRRLG